MEKISAAGKVSGSVLESNKRVVEEFEEKMQEFAEYQKKSYRTMEQVRRLLADISVSRNNGEIHLSSGKSARDESLEELKEILTAQTEQQQELMEELTRSMKEISKSAQKGKFGLFR